MDTYGIESDIVQEEIEKVLLAYPERTIRPVLKQPWSLLTDMIFSFHFVDSWPKVLQNVNDQYRMPLMVVTPKGRRKGKQNKSRM